MVTLFNLLSSGEKAKKARVPIEVTLAGMVTDSRPVLENVLVRIVFIPFSSLTCLNSKHELNA